MRTFTLIAGGVLAAALFVMSGCTQPKSSPMPLGDLKIGVAYYTQPKSNAEMLAGYLPEQMSSVDAKVLSGLNSDFAEAMQQEASHKIHAGADSTLCAQKVAAAKVRQPAIRTWAAVGRCMGVDLLVVPQVIEWRERDGGEAGVATAAKVVMDTFIVDVTHEQLISRSRYDETQTALTDNLLDTGKFFKRGAKWVSASQLAREGMSKAIKELGL